MKERAKQTMRYKKAAKAAKANTTGTSATGKPPKKRKEKEKQPEEEEPEPELEVLVHGWDLFSVDSQCQVLRCQRGEICSLSNYSLYLSCLSCMGTTFTKIGEYPRKPWTRSGTFFYWRSN